MKKLLGRVALPLAAFACLAVPVSASAADYYGYICETKLYPSTATVYGNHGYANVTMYSGPTCTGTYQGSFWVFTEGSTDSWANPYFLYREGSLHALYESMVRAALANKQIHLWTNPSWPNAVGYIGFTPKS
ncbi:hypothetical protein NR798_15415 [Archangium gephyra]|uniref:hypothetical protein n=1 Tax=Archangium gephyra TaxID=48 RepID=UPI0035D43BDF